ncbi:hypothetical protein JCM19314_601 [Nonlabens ulvanivorans]|uniref:DNA alkylation repair enzyme n=1 Tax=Nonlabens ulvanivorans TaxID=906888 RepID=A0A090R0D5_NONUL|nr:hypothetical protein [Nonlabens ulvanivorans]GAL01157.1 hypothetical protein JCM19314_601 [Nonlabens ulvanivorans]
MVDKLKLETSWKIEDIEKLFFYLKKNPEERTPLFWEMSEKNFHAFFECDIDFFKSISLRYFDWFYSSSFSFDYCDVIADRVWSVYSISNDLELKSEAALKLSKLAARHNRWYVMEYVVKMCSPRIDEMLAARISIEIKIAGRWVKRDFRSCVERLSRTVKSYHESIQEVLEEDPPLNA